MGLSRLKESCTLSWRLRQESFSLEEVLLTSFTHLSNLDTPVEQPLRPNAIPVVPDIVQQAAVRHQLSNQLDWWCQADSQQAAHMRVIHTRHHIRFLHRQQCYWETSTGKSELQMQLWSIFNFSASFNQLKIKIQLFLNHLNVRRYLVERLKIQDTKYLTVTNNVFV